MEEYSKSDQKIDRARAIRTESQTTELKVADKLEEIHNSISSLNNFGLIVKTLKKDLPLSITILGVIVGAVSFFYSLKTDIAVVSQNVSNISTNVEKLDKKLDDTNKKLDETASQVEAHFNANSNRISILEGFLRSLGLNKIQD